MQKDKLIMLRTKEMQSDPPPTFSRSPTTKPKPEIVSTLHFLYERMMRVSKRPRELVHCFSVLSHAGRLGPLSSILNHLLPSAPSTLLFPNGS